MVNHTYAYFLDDFWFRGIVTDINLGVIKVSINIFMLVICPQFN